MERRSTTIVIWFSFIKERKFGVAKKILVQSQARVFAFFSFAAGGGEENFIPTSSILIGAQIAAKEPSSKLAEMLAGVAWTRQLV